jgi:hypothetical protein
MKTPKTLYPQAREIYHCELPACPECGEPLVICNYQNGRKIVQTLPLTLSVGYCPKRCLNRDCLRYDQRFGSAQWQHLAPQYCTYGYDVIAQIGWQRQRCCRQFASIHGDLRERDIQISESEVRHLYHQRFLPLLACYERTNWPDLRQLSRERGLILSLDGLVPEGGEPQLWVIRELQTGLTLRCGWMSRQDQDAFENFLRPIVAQEVLVLAIMSDKQSGLLPAIATIFPNVKHALCHLHYLKSLADPIAKADQIMKTTLRETVRQQVGDLLRQEQVENPGVLTVTGMIPTPIEEESPVVSVISSDPVEQEREDIVETLLRRVHYLLTLRGRAPSDFAGLETVERLTEVMNCLVMLIAHDPASVLVQLQRGLEEGLRAVANDYEKLRQTSEWLKHISNLLNPKDDPLRTGDEVREALFAYLAELRKQTDKDAVLSKIAQHFYGVSSRYAVGLFHTYDIPELPRTNNDRESEFRDLRRRLLMTTGQKGATRRWLHRSGAWELIPCPDTFEETVTALTGVSEEEFCQERERMCRHRSRFTSHTRSAKRSRKQLHQLQDQWCNLPPRASPV